MEFLEKNIIEWMNEISTFMCLFLKSQTVLEKKNVYQNENTRKCYYFFFCLF